MIRIVLMICLVLTGRSVLAQNVKEEPFGMVTGTVAYLQRIALPPNTNLRIRLEDVSRQDVAATLIAEVTLPTAGKQVPVPFAIPYRRADIVVGHRYQVRATFLVGEKMIFTSTKSYPVLSGGASSDVAIIVQAVSSPVNTPAPALASRPSFINTVWKVGTSRDVEPGQMYVFLSDGSLIVASRHGKPLLGAWTYKNGALTMIEDGRRYPVDIVKLTPTEFRIKMRNPGGAAEMTLVPAR